MEESTNQEVQDLIDDIRARLQYWYKANAPIGDNTIALPPVPQEDNNQNEETG